MFFFSIKNGSKNVVGSKKASRKKIYFLEIFYLNDKSASENQVNESAYQKLQNLRIGSI